jgi:serine protease
MRSKVLVAVPGLGIINGPLLAVGPAQAAQVCQVAPHGAADCYDDGTGTGNRSTRAAPSPGPTKGGAYAIVGAIRTKCVASGGMRGPLGAPLAGETTGLRAGGATLIFKGSAIVWSSWTGAQISKGDPHCLAEDRCPKGDLGYPTTDEFTTAEGRILQGFQHGRISWTAATGTTVIPGAAQATS